MPAFVSGYIARSTTWQNEISELHSTGENRIRVIEEINPPYIDQRAPRVVKFFQNSEQMIVGRFAEAATAKAKATRNATFWPWAAIPPRMDRIPTTTTIARPARISPLVSSLHFLMT